MYALCLCVQKQAPVEEVDEPRSQAMLSSLFLRSSLRFLWPVSKPLLDTDRVRHPGTRRGMDIVPWCEQSSPVEGSTDPAWRVGSA